MIEIFKFSLINIATIFVNLLIVIFRDYVPSYIKKKGENLATKQDIEKITRKTEEVQKEFKEKFENFSLDARFKHDFFYRQYAELYCKLYAIVIQSEYTRHFIQASKGEIITFDKAPFIEIGPKHKSTTTVTYDKENDPSISSNSEYIDTEISQFSKKELVDCIIKHGHLASQKLLKLAVSYRFAAEFYSGNIRGEIKKERETADEEEFQLIKDLVVEIVRDYNKLRKDLNITYNKEELEKGIPKLYE